MAQASRRRKPPVKVKTEVELDKPPVVVETVQYPDVVVSVLHGDELGTVLEKVLAGMAARDKNNEFVVDVQERRMFIARLFKLPKNDWLKIIRKTVVLRVISGKGAVFPTLAIEEIEDNTPEGSTV